MIVLVKKEITLPSGRKLVPGSTTSLDAQEAAQAGDAIEPYTSPDRPPGAQDRMVHAEGIRRGSTEDAT